MRQRNKHGGAFHELPAPKIYTTEYVQPFPTLKYRSPSLPPAPQRARTFPGFSWPNFRTTASRVCTLCTCGRHVAREQAYGSVVSPPCGPCGVQNENDLGLDFLLVQKRVSSSSQFST